MSFSICWLVFVALQFVRWTQAGFIENRKCGPICELRLKEMGIQVKFLQDNCKCEDSNCGCCFQGTFPTNMTQEFCMRGAFIAENFELQVRATMNGNTFGQFMLSGRNPPPLCVPVPFPIPIPLNMCLRVMDIYPMNNNMHLCVDMMMRFSGFEFLTLHLNCMLIGLGGFHLVNQ